MKWVLITGASSGFGRVLALELAKQGYNIFLHYFSNEEEINILAEKIVSLKREVKIFQADFSNSKHVQEFISTCNRELSSLYGLINNVGVYSDLSFSKSSQESILNLLNINTFSALSCMKGLFPLLKRDKGVIVNIGVSGLKHYVKEEADIYHYSKLSLLVMTLKLAKEWAQENVSVNMVSPGYLENTKVFPKKNIPMKRKALFQEIIRVIAFLLEEESKYITGQNIEVDGGASL